MKKIIHMLSSGLNKWKEKHPCVVFRLKEMERKWKKKHSGVVCSLK
jgi:hypothetical protein